MANLEWHTDDDQAEWEDRPNPSPPPPSRASRLLPLLIVALLAAGGWLLYSRLTRQVDETLARTEADLRRNTALLWQLAAENDVEPASLLLSGRDPAWLAATWQQFTNDTLLRRAPLGLHPLATEPEPFVCEIAPDLREATCLAGLPYAISVGNGLTGTVTLQLPMTWRRGGDSRWLYGPPPADFWGETLTAQGGVLDARFPARDEALARRLHRDLDSFLQQLCAGDPALTCDPARKGTLVFSPEPASLAALAWPPVGDPAAPWVLPAPSLVGLPLDEAGSRALLNGYTRQVLMLFVRGEMGLDCCSHAPSVTAFVEWWLFRLGIQPDPLGTNPDKLPDAETLHQMQISGKGAAIPRWTG